MDDPISPRNPEKVVFVSGKLYYELLEAQNGNKPDSIALVRVEQLYPFPEKHLAAIIAKYKKCRQWLWVQEEPENQGAWQFMACRFKKHLSLDLKYIGRDASPSPATGYHHVFVEEQDKIVREVINEH